MQAYQRGLHVLPDDSDDEDEDDNEGRRTRRKNAGKKAADASTVSEVERQKQDSTIGNILGLIFFGLICSYIQSVWLSVVVVARQTSDRKVAGLTFG